MKTNRPDLSIIRVQNIPIHEQLQLEEALLRTDYRNWCLINEGSPKAIVMGISGKPHELLNLPKLRQRPIPVIRRFSGGGTVIVDHHTCFVTFICNATDVDVQGTPDKMIHWTGTFYHSVFEEMSFAIRENDYVLGERKFGGNAQYICKERWLHHSSLLWNFQEESMDYLLMPKKMPLYRQQRSHVDFLCRLQDHFSSQQILLDRLYKSLEQQFHIHPVDWEEAWGVTNRPHRKGTSVVDISVA